MSDQAAREVSEGPSAGHSGQGWSAGSGPSLIAQDRLLPAITYKPGWTFEWEHSNHEPHLFLLITVTQPDAKGFDRDDLTERTVNFKFAIAEPGTAPDSGVRAFSTEWLRNKIAGIESHEIDEWLRVDGTLVNDPHSVEPADDARVHNGEPHA